MQEVVGFIPAGGVGSRMKGFPIVKETWFTIRFTRCINPNVFCTCSASCKWNGS